MTFEDAMDLYCKVMTLIFEQVDLLNNHVEIFDEHYLHNIDLGLMIRNGVDRHMIGDKLQLILIYQMNENYVYQN